MSNTIPATVTKTEFDSFVLEKASAHTRREPRMERDSNTLYECFDNDDGEEVAFIAWTEGSPTYMVRS